MRGINWGFWYYLMLILAVLTLLILGDFSRPGFANRLLLIFLVLMFLHPFVFLWRREKRRIYLRAASAGEPAGTRKESASEAAHLLRTPLSGVKWAIESLVRGNLGPVQPEQKNVLERSAENIERVFGLINDFLHPRPAGFQTTDLTALFNTTAVSFIDRFRAKDIDFQITAPAEKVIAEVEPVKIRTVLETILDNALTYTLPGGTVTAVLRTTTANGKTVAELVVSDSGIGIHPADQPRIFSRFFRGSNAASLNQTGGGIGLSLAKSAVQEHNGEIWFESEVGRGSTFHVAFPLQRQ